MYNASEKRYENMIYNRCGNSGLKLRQYHWGSGTISAIQDPMRL